MPRKERLPENVSSFVDRHGKRRYRWRKDGRTVAINAVPGTREFDEAVKAARLSKPVRQERHEPGTVGWTAARYYASPAFTREKNAQTQHTARSILDRFVTQFAKERVADFRFDHIEAVLTRASKRRVEKGRTIGGPHAANNLRGELLPFFRYAIKLGLIATNPVELASAPKAATVGFHTWTEDEIAQYRARHPLGTKARLALEIFLWTAQRRGDASTFGRKHLKGGKVQFVASKTGRTVWLPAAPQLLEAIEAMPVTGTEAFLVTDYGKPFSKAGLGNKMREWCDEAGLPHCSAHGLRKATARRAAEQGATNQQLKAVGGWTTDAQVGVYTAAAGQALMADQALSPVIAFDRLANRGGTKGES